MITEIIMPKMGQTMEEGTVVEWVKKEGEPVSKGEVFMIIQTDKAEIEVESSFDGVLRKVLCPAGVTVPVLTVIALAGPEDEPLPDLSKYQEPVKAAAGGETATAERRARAGAARAERQGAQAGTVVPSGAKVVSPRARKLAAEKGIDPRTIEGSGPGGRIVTKDVEAAIDALRRVKATPVARKIARELGVDLTRVTGSGPSGRIVRQDVERIAAAGEDIELMPEVAETVPLTPVRRITGERLSKSKFTAPHYYETFDVDMSSANALRAELVAETESRLRFRISVSDLVLKATAMALDEFPQVNARLNGSEVEYLKQVNIGLAVAVDDGLVVPVLRDLGGCSIEEIAQRRAGVTEGARAGKLMPDDFVGGTFTVSNLGMFGVDEFTAIINPPESAILAVGRSKDRPVAVDGDVVIRPIMRMTMSVDHRVIDGVVAARFLGRIRELLEASDSLRA